MSKDIRIVLNYNEIELSNTFIVLYNQGYVVNNKKKDKLNTLIILNHIFNDLIPFRQEQENNSINFYNNVINL